MMLPSRDSRTVETKLPLSPRNGVDLARVGGDPLGLCASGETMLKIDLLKTKCACGCGERISPLNSRGGPRRFATQHQGRLLSGSAHPCWRGGRVLQQGYVFVKVGRKHPLANSNGYAAEHRMVAESKLRRPLSMGEVVHHLNGNTTDNRADNIQVLSSQHQHTMKHGGKLSQCQVDEIRRRYIHRVVTQRMLAAEYGISRELVSSIVLGKRRKSSPE